MPTSSPPPLNVVEPDALTFGVEDFKSIAQAFLPGRRLTLLAGANSSGKSSLLQAVLLLAQSILESSVVINGDLVRLGEPGDVIRTGTDHVTYSFEYPFEQEIPNSQTCTTLTLKLQNRGNRLTTTELSLASGNNTVITAVATDRPPPANLVAPQGEIPLRIRSEDKSLPDSYILVAGLTPATLACQLPKDAVIQAVIQMVREMGQGRQPLVETALRTVPSDDARRPALASLLTRFRQGAIVEAEDADLMATLGILAEALAPGGWIIEALSPAGVSSHLGRFGMAVALIPQTLQILSSELASAVFRAVRFAERVVYLGPLRDDPRFAYPLGHTVSALPVGGKGEFTAAYLMDNARQWVNYQGPDGTKRGGRLQDVVKMWSRELEIAEDVSVRPMGKLGHQLGLSLGGAERDPTAVGVGASQLLPVVVLVLGAPSGSTVLLEQPELHLHPKVQSKLGDFLALARPDLRLVVETHSEYLITRLRLRLAEGLLPPQAVSVLFASQRPGHETNDLYTEFEALTPNDLGDFSKWPENFFDSLDKEGVAYAEAVNRRVRELKQPEQQ